MILIQEILVSATLIEEHFVCHLERCKGACCWKGDFGAPLEPAEINILDEVLPKVTPYLPGESVQRIEQEGFARYYAEKDMTGTNLLDNGACVFMTTNDAGIAGCGIQNAWADGVIEFKKPVSCHLYPIRVTSNPELGFEALNYDEWDICSPACALGAELKVPLYQFAREAIVRTYGQEFYDELDSVATDIRSSRGK